MTRTTTGQARVDATRLHFDWPEASLAQIRMPARSGEAPSSNCFVGEVARSEGKTFEVCSWAEVYDTPEG